MPKRKQRDEAVDPPAGKPAQPKAAGRPQQAVAATAAPVVLQGPSPKPCLHKGQNRDPPAALRALAEALKAQLRVSFGDDGVGRGLAVQLMPSAAEGAALGQDDDVDTALRRRRVRELMVEQCRMQDLAPGGEELLFLGSERAAADAASALCDLPWVPRAPGRPQTCRIWTIWSAHKKAAPPLFIYCPMQTE